MKEFSPESQTQFDQHLQALAQLLYDHTEPEKLQDFESIEVELRAQLLEKVTPRIGEFFFLREENALGANNEKLKVVWEK